MTLVDAILAKNLVEAEKILMLQMVTLLEKKLIDRKRAVASKLCEVDLLYPKEKEKKDKDKDDDKDEKDVHEEVDALDARPNTNWSVWRTKVAVQQKIDKLTQAGHKVIGSTWNNGGDSGWHSASIEYTHGKTGETKSVTVNPNIHGLKESELTEAMRIKIVRARIRNGKIQRRKRVANVPGFTIRAGKLTRMSPAERRRRKLGQRRGKIKRRAKIVQINRKRDKSMRKRKALGIR